MFKWFGSIALILIFSNSFALQKFAGASAFSAATKTPQWLIRIGIDPGSLSKGEKSNKAIMDKITVIGCAFGHCQFAKANYGLGYYEILVKPNKVGTHPFKLQAVACSLQGCIQKTMTIIPKATGGKS